MVNHGNKMIADPIAHLQRQSDQPAARNPFLLICQGSKVFSRKQPKARLSYGPSNKLQVCPIW
jgi:hypothetical protein